MFGVVERQMEACKADSGRVDWQGILFAVLLRSQLEASTASASGATEKPCGWLPGRLAQVSVIEEALRLSLWSSSPGDKSRLV